MINRNRIVDNIAFPLIMFADPDSIQSIFVWRAHIFEKTVDEKIFLRSEYFNNLMERFEVIMIVCQVHWMEILKVKEWNVWIYFGE